MKILKPVLFSGIFIIGALTSVNATSMGSEMDIGIERIEAQDVSFEQVHLCPYPMQLEAKIYNKLKIAGLKNYSYRWVLNDQVIGNGRFDVYPTAYGAGYDKQKIIVHVSDNPAQAQADFKEKNPGIVNYFKVKTHFNPPSQGWYQFLVLPAGESNWYDAVKSNKADYKINCKS